MTMHTRPAYPLPEYETDELLGFLTDAAVEQSLLERDGRHDDADELNGFISEIRHEVLGRCER